MSNHSNTAPNSPTRSPRTVDSTYETPRRSPTAANRALLTPPALVQRSGDVHMTRPNLLANPQFIIPLARPTSPNTVALPPALEGRTAARSPSPPVHVIRPSPFAAMRNDIAPSAADDDGACETEVATASTTASNGNIRSRVMARRRQRLAWRRLLADRDGSSGSVGSTTTQSSSSYHLPFRYSGAFADLHRVQSARIPSPRRPDLRSGMFRLAPRTKPFRE